MSARVEDYIAWDPNTETRSAVEALNAAGNVAELDKLLGERLQFGTAGLRGPMGPGYSRMNELVVLQTCQGLIRYIESLDNDAKSKVPVHWYYNNITWICSSTLSLLLNRVL